MHIFKIKACPRSLGTYVWWKGIIDRLFAFLALVVLSPILVAIAIGIRIDSPGSPVFRQERVGKDESKFTLYKFRSMYQDNDNSKYQAYLKKYVQENLSLPVDETGRDIYELIRDPRITRIGSILRRTNLDELPQLVNIIKGEMSFVGPRPDIPFAVAMYKESHFERFRVKPGITGLWQVAVGRRRLTFDDVVKLDVDYIKRQSFLLDIKILLLTLSEMVVSNGTRETQKITEGIKT
jgi:lipopolysaccharide/colanic/teichoic acid biosynthesis glycosyltransferase